MRQKDYPEAKLHESLFHRAAEFFQACATRISPPRANSRSRLIKRAWTFWNSALPFSDPLADGLVNQLAAQRGLEFQNHAAETF